MEGDLGASDLDVLDGLDNGGVLLVDVEDGKAGVVRLPLWLSASGWDGDAEGQVLSLGVDLSGLNGKGWEDWESDAVQVRACAWDHEVLVEGREGKFSGRCGEEWKCARELVQETAVETVLFALLTDDGSYTADKTSITI